METNNDTVLEAIRSFTIYMVAAYTSASRAEQAAVRGNDAEALREARLAMDLTSMSQGALNRAERLAKGEG